MMVWIEHKGKYYKKSHEDGHDHVEQCSAREMLRGNRVEV